MTETFHRTIEDGHLAEGGCTAVQIHGWPVLLCRAGGDVHAVIDRCTHAASPLSGGRIRRGAIMCPAHGAHFNLADGTCIGKLAYRPLKVFAVRITDGWIEVAVPDGKPPAEYEPVSVPTT